MGRMGCVPIFVRQRNVLDGVVWCEQTFNPTIFFWLPNILALSHKVSTIERIFKRILIHAPQIPSFCLNSLNSMKVPLNHEIIYKHWEKDAVWLMQRIYEPLLYSGCIKLRKQKLFQSQ